MKQAYLPDKDGNLPWASRVVTLDFIQPYLSDVLFLFKPKNKKRKLNGCDCNIQPHDNQQFSHQKHKRKKVCTQDRMRPSYARFGLVSVYSGQARAVRPAFSVARRLLGLTLVLWEERSYGQRSQRTMDVPPVIYCLFSLFGVCSANGATGR